VVQGEIPEPFASYKQHWVSQGAKKGDRPYTCLGLDCPLCDISDKASATYVFNVAQFVEGQDPALKLLRLGVTAYRAFKEAATPKGKTKPAWEATFFAVYKSGTGRQIQTNFKSIKERDLEDDWEEIFDDDFGPDDVEPAIDELREKCFTPKDIEMSTRKQLKELVKYLVEDDDEEDD
jgi:hypothetical protein